MTTASPGTFAGKVAIVTGGGSGIGAAVAAQLRVGGAGVSVLDIAPGNADDEPVDITDPKSVSAFAERFGRAHPHCHILINCAGAIAPGTVAECSEGDWQRVFDINVTGIRRVCMNVLPFMPPGSSIVNVSSGAGLRGIPAMAGYVAAKHAVVGLTRAMAIDHADDGIRVNCVCPGLVDTPMARAAQEQRPADVEAAVDSFKGYLIKRQGSADEIAASICFLASDAAGYTTGATLAVDGGRSQH